MSELTAEEVRAALTPLLERRTTTTRTTTMGAGSDDLGAGRTYLAKMATGGWHTAGWPSEVGGRGADRAEAAMIAGVRREFVIPDLYPFGVGLDLVAPTILAHGTAEQQQRWLPSIGNGSEIWCQMFSEPDAGSDLANVGLRAERDGDEWVLSGQKVWTSRGPYADWAICLARTDPEVPKHAGLTMFAVKMSDPGVEVRPLVQMNGDSHFSEVFADDARVPDSQRLGDIGAGWKVTVTVLAFERASAGGGGGGGGSRGPVPTWLTDLADQLSSPVDRDRAMRVHADGMVARWTGQRARAEARAGGSPGPAGSGGKLRGVATYNGRAALTTDLQGAKGMLTSAAGYIETMTAPSMSIRGGTDEIQRNILGERVLGLPGEPRADRDRPWSESRTGGL